MLHISVNARPLNAQWRAATDPKTAAIHAEMAERYEALVEKDRRPTLHILSRTSKVA
jgi:hypothetical protein